MTGYVVELPGRSMGFFGTNLSGIKSLEEMYAGHIVNKMITASQFMFHKEVQSSLLL